MPKALSHVCERECTLNHPFEYVFRVLTSLRLDVLQRWAPNRAVKWAQLQELLQVYTCLVTAS